MINLNNHRGQGKLSFLLFLLFCVACAYFGSQALPIWYDKEEILGLMESQAAKAQVITDEEIRDNILKRIKELNIPIKSQDDLLVFRTEGKITIELYYNEVIYLDIGSFFSKDLYIWKMCLKAEREV